MEDGYQIARSYNWVAMGLVGARVQREDALLAYSF